MVLPVWRGHSCPRAVAFVPRCRLYADERGWARLEPLVVYLYSVLQGRGWNRFRLGGFRLAVSRTGVSAPHQFAARASSGTIAIRSFSVPRMRLTSVLAPTRVSLSTRCRSSTPATA